MRLPVLVVTVTLAAPVIGVPLESNVIVAAVNVTPAGNVMVALPVGGVGDIV